MSPHRLVFALLIPVVVVTISGCGGSGGGDGNPPGTRDGTQTFDLGAVRGEVAASAGFNMIHFDAGADLPVAFTCLYGARILFLDEWGYGRLAVALRAGGRWGIASVSDDGWHRQVLKNSNENDWDPAVSPDGSRIAYTRTYALGHSDIYVMNADGSGNANLTASGHFDRSPTWDPTGTRIAFVSDRDGFDEIYVMNDDGTGITRVTNVLNARDPAWSPDGRWIAFTARISTSSWDIYTCSPKGTDLARVTLTTSPSEVEPCWSPDGAQLAYSRKAGVTAYEVWAMNADGTNQRVLTHDPGSDYGHPAWSPDGRRIAVDRKYSPGPGRGIDVINLSSGLLTHITYGTRQEMTADWFTQPSMLRRLVGPDGSDYGADPPLGNDSPVAIVGVTQDGLASAATIRTPASHYPSLKAEALPRTGSELAGLAVTGGKIRSIQEDTGRGSPPRRWYLLESGVATHVAIFFSGETGRVVSVIAGQDVVFADGAASAGTIHLRGAFTEAYDARNPSLNRLTAETKEVAIDARTGEVLSAS